MPKHSAILFNQTETVPIIDADTATEMLGAGEGTVTLSDVFWEVGKNVELELEGFIDTSIQNVELNLNIQIGGVTIGVTRDTSFVKLVETQVNSYFNIKLNITCKTIGVAGTFLTNGVLNISDTNVANYGAVHSFGLVRYDGGNIDNTDLVLNTTIESDISALWTWATASSGIGITITNATIKE